MEDSQSDSKIFSVRIVSIDYYMSPPIPDLDLCYSSFQGGKVNEVPVIRVYGSTPAGQKTCLHIHQALPYLYVPCSDIVHQPDQEGDACVRMISLALEKALKLKGSAGSKRQHVHSCSLVRARRFYGYDASEQLYAKLYLYHPQDVSRAAKLLLGGSVLEKSLQPHESHIPFLLQFLVDYNLHGMGHLHVSKMKFRLPVPHVFTRRKANYYVEDEQPMDQSSIATNSQADSNGDVFLESTIWLSSTIPDTWTWHSPSQNLEDNLVKRQSVCELEGDAAIDDILNQQYKLYSSLSQTLSDVRMVQSLIPIWEEFENTGMHMEPISSDPGRPSPHNVLSALSNKVEFENNLLELCAAESSLPCTPTETEKMFLQSVRSLSEGRDMVESGQVNIENDSSKHLQSSNKRLLLSQDSQHRYTAKPDDMKSGSPVLLSSGELQSSEAIFSYDLKVADPEALRLLNWLASSQAAEDINSDDELIRETILSPLMPATTINKVLEKADMEFVSASQQECQDILDCVEDSTDVECKNKSKSSPSTFDGNSSPQSLSRKEIPQVDGSGDGKKLVHYTGKTSNMEKSLKERVQLDSGSSFSRKHKRNRPLWSSLPFCLSENMNDVQPTNVKVGKCDGEIKIGTETCAAATNAGRCSDDAEKCLSKLGSTIVGCSLRDLMRRKRSHRGERPTVEICHDAEVTPEEESNDYTISSTKRRNDEQETCPPTVGDSEAIYVKDMNVEASAVQASGVTGTSAEDLEISTRTTLMQSDEGDGVHSRHTVEDKDIDEWPHFVDGTYQEVKHTKSKIDDPTPRQDQAMGVPTHYCNDGSHLYMLTPAMLPPSADDVKRWLLHDGTDVLRENVNASTEESSSPKGSLGHAMDSLDFSADMKNGPLLDSGSTFSIETNLDHSKKLGQGSHVLKPQTCTPRVPAVLRTEENTLQSQQHNICLQDVSQISGPEGKSKLTPLSQAGFRDPASIGAGQQLTMFSIEVQAESRGDLRPDPRFDAVSFIAVAIQEDDESIINSYVLLRSETAAVRRNLDGITGCKLLVCTQEKQLFNDFVEVISNHDPDILIGWDIQGGSLGFLAERAAYLGIGLLSKISRTPSQTILNAGVSDIPDKGMVGDVLPEAFPDIDPLNDAIIEDEWGRTHASGVHVGGRIVLNLWRLARGEVKLNMYTAEAVVEAVLRRKIPFIHCRTLTKWFASGPGKARYRCIEYVLERAKLNFQVMNQLDMINRTSELARVFGIDFFSVLSRGSQYRVESMLVRLAHTQNYLAISPGSQQVACQPAMECMPLVMEPESGFYADPVVVLDFQSLYPSMVIAYNLCFCTCLGKVTPSKPNTLGVSSYTPEPDVLQGLKHEVLLTPNGVMYVPSKVRKGILPRLLDEILSTRIMVKQAMKKLSPSQKVLHRIYNARQLALKLIANVTYGYTAAGFSGRMPCAELADSIVQCGRRTLETAILLVNTHDKWKAKVIYGDTDSMFVLLPGRSVSEAFQVGNEIASAVTKMNPTPVVLKMEKVYHSCFLLTKKRYVGYSYEKPDQVKPVFDAKGIETVRRDTCGAVSKTLEHSLRNYFENQDISKVKSYLLRQWSRILSGRVSVQDFIFAKEVRLGTYSSRVTSLPPAAIVATKAIRADPRAEPRYAERIPYVVVHGEPGARLVDMVVDPLDLLAVDSPYRLNDLYYINKQIIPALQRVFGLLGVDLNQWFLDMPRPLRESIAKNQSHGPNSHRTRIDYYYLSKHCIMCGELVQASGAAALCGECSRNEAAVAVAVTGRTSKMERKIQHLAAICRHCGGGDWVIESGVKCTSLACSVFYERQKAQKGLKSLSTIATESGFYPKCSAEWF
ncbi:DNA polymerase zeta catalytic subunit isoform X1 [Cynara cardunculus var. scolymus]|uniref:DNA polymerase zeta catalytic subunit isoform X1 n=1 Tax=Cynara cardunculus var. scolymus TaxID=59895 RepID=UPI000D625C0C|nr:DNA polymerase zeta catalytic subunit isoform X1 [Cynara cardunculus var. scolymus]